MEVRSSRRMRTLVTQMACRGLSANEVARALISMMAGSLKRSNQRPDTLMQDRSLPTRRRLLRRAAGPYIRVRSGHRESRLCMSALGQERTTTKILFEASHVQCCHWFLSFTTRSKEIAGNPAGSCFSVKYSRRQRTCRTPGRIVCSEHEPGGCDEETPAGGFGRAHADRCRTSGGHAGQGAPGRSGARCV